MSSPARTGIIEPGCTDTHAIIHRTGGTHNSMSVMIALAVNRRMHIRSMRRITLAVVEGNHLHCIAHGSNHVEDRLTVASSHTAPGSIRLIHICCSNGGDFCGSRKDTCYQLTERLRFSPSLSADGLPVQQEQQTKNASLPGKRFAAPLPLVRLKWGFSPCSPSIRATMQRASLGRAALPHQVGKKTKKFSRTGKDRTSSRGSETGRGWCGCPQRAAPAVPSPGTRRSADGEWQSE